MAQGQAIVRPLAYRWCRQDRLEQFAFVEGANDGGDHIHQLQMLSFHIVGKEALRFGSSSKNRW